MHQLYKVWWYCILPILLIAFLLPGDTFTLQLHSTYFVISSISVAIVVSAYLFFIGFTYFLGRHQKHNRWIDWIHTYSSTITIMSVLTNDSITELIYQFGSPSTSMQWIWQSSWIWLYSSILFLAVQPLLIIKLIQAYYLGR